MLICYFILKQHNTIKFHSLNAVQRVEITLKLFIQQLHNKFLRKYYNNKALKEVYNKMVLDQEIKKLQISITIINKINVVDIYLIINSKKIYIKNV